MDGSIAFIMHGIRNHVEGNSRDRLGRSLPFSSLSSNGNENAPQQSETNSHANMVHHITVVFISLLATSDANFLW